MKFRNLLSHLTAALALAVVVILVIMIMVSAAYRADIFFSHHHISQRHWFFNSAMYLAAGREFKYLCMALSVCAIVCAVMQRRETK